MSGQAWVHGRDDNLGLALLRPIAEPRTYPFLPLSSDQPQLNAPMGLVQFNGTSTAPDLLDTTITGYRQSIGGCSWVQIRATDSATSNGAVVFTTSGKIQGVRMPSVFVLNAGIGATGQVFACTGADIGTNIPLLQGGSSRFSPAPDSCDSGTIPPLPTIYHGNLSVNGQVAPVGTRVYARIRITGKPDVWKSRRTKAAGRYTFPISVCANGYNGATIEFWSDARKASATSVYRTGSGAGTTVERDLAF